MMVASRPPAVVTMPVSRSMHRAGGGSVGTGTDTGDDARDIAGVGSDGAGVGGDGHHARTACPSNVKGFGRPASRPGFPLQSRYARFPLQSLTPPRASARSALSLGRRLATLTAACRADAPAHSPNAAMARAPMLPRDGAAHRPRQRLASLALAGCAGGGRRVGPSRRHALRRRCRLRRPPARAPRRAVASAQVRTAPPALPPTCRARPHAAPAALPPAQVRL